MAVTHISFNDQLTHGRLLRRSLQQLEEGRTELNNTIATMSTMLDGDGTNVSHFLYFVSKYGFPSTAEAKAAWDELNSLASKLNVNTSVTDVNAALLQAFNKFR